MAIISPLELGALLKLEQALGGRQARVLTSQETVKIGLEAPSRLSGSSAVDYWEHFSALYLPSYLQTYLHGTLMPPDGDFIPAQLYAEWFKQITGTSMFARYVRWHPESARDCFSAYAELIAAVNPEWVLALPAASQKWFPNTLFMSLRMFYNALSLHVLPDTPIGTISPSSGRRLLVLLPYSDAPEDHKEVYVDIVERLVEGGVMFNEAYSAGSRARQGAVWWVCERRRKTEDTGVQCVKMAEEEEMKMCEQCECVRYCGRSHQKVDWKKRHKAVCMKPTW